MKNTATRARKRGFGARQLVAWREYRIYRTTGNSAGKTRRRQVGIAIARSAQGAVEAYHDDHLWTGFPITTLSAEECA